MVSGTGHKRHLIRHVFYFHAEDVPYLLSQFRSSGGTGRGLCNAADQGGGITGASRKTATPAVHARENIAYSLDALIDLHVKNLAAESEQQGHDKPYAGENDYGSKDWCHHAWSLNSPGLGRKSP
jgi:hypothetical protein